MSSIVKEGNAEKAWNSTEITLLSINEKVVKDQTMIMTTMCLKSRDQGISLEEVDKLNEEELR
eukprot:4587533-Karenia_brevis.AAC.1